MPTPFLEPEYRDAYSAWREDPSPLASRQLVTALQPAIDKAVTAHVGPAPGPVIASRARLMTLDALRTYDPNKAKLGTHVHNTLQGLKRYQRQQTAMVRVPERVAQERMALLEAERSLEEEHGRPPSAAELADHTGLSLRRIARLQQLQHGVTEGQLSPEPGFQPGVRGSGQGHQLWAETVYQGLSGADQLILEHTLGLHGRPVLSVAALGRKLRLSPGAISQRRARLQRYLDQEQELSPWSN